MLNPPFKLAASAGTALTGAYQTVGCCDEPITGAGSPGLGRARLAQLNPQFFCSVIGTCLSVSELGKIVARFIDVHGLSDVEIHHEAVRLVHQGGPAAKALHKALDQRHEAAISHFAKAHDALALQARWDEALHHGEIPGAYWALLTHREATPALRQKAFGEVHMLSHLVGAANRADIRRLAALEQENTELRERLERQQLRSQEAAAGHEHALSQLRNELTQASLQWELPGDVHREDRSAEAQRVAVQTERRERAEQAAAGALAEAARLQQELDHLQRHVGVLMRELGVAETQLREMNDAGVAKALSLDSHLRTRRILYVGGRPSSTPAIRSLVLRHGGEFQRHDGGLEDRKGLLAAAVTGADLVVFPVDCIDHDSAGNLKRLCARQGIPFIPMRSASVASFAAAIAAQPLAPQPIRSSERTSGN